MRAFKAWAVTHPAWPRGILWKPTNEPRIYTEKSHAEYYAGLGKVKLARPLKIVRVEVREIRKKKVMAILVVFSLLTGHLYAETGIATFYTEKSCQRDGNSGKLTASGEVFDEDAMTCALPPQFGREYMVVNLDTGQSVVVRHNDTGPGKKPRKRGVVVDLTPAAFKALGGNPKKGKINVGIQEIK